MKTDGKYILVDGEVVEEHDLLKWGQWFETGERKIEITGRDGVKVSTVFLGLDHSFGEGPPLLFETMVFGGSHDQDMDRYSTIEEAKAGHVAMVAKVWPDGAPAND